MTQDPKSSAPQRLNARNEIADRSLRPADFADFVGQDRTVERLKIMAGAARKRGEALGHVLLSGPPGLGKTTIAMILGQEMGSNIRVTSGPVIEKAGDLAGLLTSLEPRDILFIDEIHRVPRAVEEYLYSAMEDFRIDIMIDQGPNARSVSLKLPPFTLVGATTRTGLLSAPLRSRFVLQTRLDYYSKVNLAQIVARNASLLSFEIDGTCAGEIAGRARGTPRIANNLLRFVRDFAQQRGEGRVSMDAVREALQMLEIDTDGLDEMDRKILVCMAQNYGGGPVGFGTVAVAVGEDLQTIEEVHEPYLIAEGYIQRTAQGRVLTNSGWQKVGLAHAPTGDNSQI
ncbi:MAG: Holliday junction branch migration DNA helicase RuvB [Puniceicoccales bacterium]|jgi:Holliday junction DNA helicase RuvB|nr:Holliday junction branch migration DNA helicase RuvB [Puniceicoccales bacterium]